VISRTIKSVAAAGLMAGALIAVAPHAFASSHSSSAGDTDDNISPASKPVTSNLKVGTKFVATGTIDGVSITVTCTKSTFKGTTPAKGLGPVKLAAPPSFTGCTDSLHGTDTVKTTGTWMLTFKDAANDETAEKSGDQLVLTVPKDGATFSSNVLSACKVIVAPNGPVNEASSYNDAGTAVASHDALPVKGSGCTTSPTSSVSETLTVTPAIKDVS
jgi:hypothetical protein